MTYQILFLIHVAADQSNKIYIIKIIYYGVSYPYQWFIIGVESLILTISSKAPAHGECKDTDYFPFYRCTKRPEAEDDQEINRNILRQTLGLQGPDKHQDTIIIPYMQGLGGQKPSLLAGYL